MITFMQGDYIYTTIDSDPTTVSVRAKAYDDITQAVYGSIPPYVTNENITYTVTSLYNQNSDEGCFENRKFSSPILTGSKLPNTIIDMQYAFRNSNISQVSASFVFPSSVTNLKGCFENCRSLHHFSATIPNSVTAMQACFKNCTSLLCEENNSNTIINLPNSVTNLAQCFYRCFSIKKAPTIPNSVTNMYACFCLCSGLLAPPLIIPSTVNRMDECFSGCTSLVGYIYAFNQPSIYGNMFDNTSGSIIIRATGQACYNVWSTIANNYNHVKAYLRIDNIDPTATYAIEIKDYDRIKNNIIYTQAEQRYITEGPEAPDTEISIDHVATLASLTERINELEDFIYNNLTTTVSFTIDNNTSIQLGDENNSVNNIVTDTNNISWSLQNSIASGIEWLWVYCNNPSVKIISIVCSQFPNGSWVTENSGSSYGKKLSYEGGTSPEYIYGTYIIKYSLMN